MKLLALLLLLVLRRVEWRRNVAAWRAALSRVLLLPLPLAAALAGSGPGRLLVLVLLWAGVGFALRFGLGDFLLSLPLLAAYVVLLWLLVGRDRLGPDLNEYLRRWYQGDEAALRAFAAERFGADGDDRAALHRAVLRQVFVRGFGETFAWIIVFALTGVPGLLALAVIETAQHARGRDPILAEAAREARARLDWLLVRLLGLSLLVTGHSARAWPVLEGRMLDDEDPAAGLVADLGIAAAGVQPGAADAGHDITDARGLLLRTQVVWILVMAVSVILGF